MNTLVLFGLLVAATCVVAEDASQYVDDALIEKVGQIVHEYDLKTAASGTSGSYAPASSATKSGTGATDVSGAYPYQWDRYQSDRYGRLNYDLDGRYTDLERRSQYDLALQQRLGYNPDLRSNLYPQSRYYNNPQSKLPYTPYSSATPYSSSTPYRTERQYSDIYRPSYLQSQSIYDINRNQRQLNLPAQPSSSLPVSRTVPSTYQYQPTAAPYKYQAAASAQRPVVRSYPEPQTKQFTGYSLSQPEAVQRIAEFHESAPRQVKTQARDNFDTVNIQGRSGMQKQTGYRLA